jgi:hypothetical protein
MQRLLLLQAVTMSICHQMSMCRNGAGGEGAVPNHLAAPPLAEQQQQQQQPVLRMTAQQTWQVLCPSGKGQQGLTAAAVAGVGAEAAVASSGSGVQLGRSSRRARAARDSGLAVSLLLLLLLGMVLLMVLAVALPYHLQRKMMPCLHR